MLDYLCSRNSFLGILDKILSTLILHLILHGVGGGRLQGGPCGKDKTSSVKQD